MKLIIDGLTVHTPTWRRGIGKVVDRLLREVLFHHRHCAIVITGFDKTLADLFGSNLGNVTFHTIDPGLMSRPYIQRAAAYSADITDLLGADQSAVFWHPNPLMLDQILPYYAPVQMLLTVYDLIPLRHKALYLDHWPQQDRDEYLRRLAFLGRPQVHLAPISHSIARQVAAILPTAAATCRAIPIAHDAELFKPSPGIAHSPDPDAPYVLLVAGDDPRKNIAGFTRAFCQWHRPGDPTALKIVCHINDATRNALTAIAVAHDCADVVQILGYVSDAALAGLVKGAAFAAMPSLDEGFGLPVLEALACGIPVVSADIPASREIGGDLLYYFDPEDTGSMLAAIAACNADVGAGRIDRAALTACAAQFSWTRAGLAYRARIAGLLQPDLPLPAGLKVAMLTPWPPQNSGVANSAMTLATALATDIDLTIVAQNAGTVTAPAGLRMITPDAFDAANFDVLICQMGNNTAFHTWIYDHALSPKALVIAHDAFIHPFLQHGFREGPLKAQYRTMLLNHYADHEVDQFERTEFQSVGVLGFTGLSELAKKAGRVVFHGTYGRDCLLREMPQVRHKLALAHLAYGPTTALDVTPLTPSPTRFTLGMFGYMTRLKQPTEVLGAVQILVSRGFPVDLRIVGRLGDEEDAIRRAILRLGLTDHVTLAGFPDEADFAAHLADCDVVVNLRHPSLGESSGVVYEAMYLGVPVVVSNGGSFADLPDDAVVKVSAAAQVQAELADQLQALLTTPDRRARIAARGRLHTRAAASLQDYAAAIRRQIAAIASSGPKDPNAS